VTGAAVADVTARCFDAECGWSWSGVQGEAVKRATAHRTMFGDHTVEIQPLVDVSDNGRQALDRMDAGEKQEPGQTRSNPEPPVASERRPAWTREDALSAIKAFAATNGRPPTTTECTRANSLPSQSVIRDLFVTFADAIVAAGFTRPTRGGRGRRRGQPKTSKLTASAKAVAAAKQSGSLDALIERITDAQAALAEACREFDETVSRLRQEFGMERAS